GSRLSPSSSHQEPSMTWLRPVDHVRYVDPQRRYTVVLGPSWNAPFEALPHDDRAGTHDSADGRCGSYASIGRGQASTKDFRRYPQSAMCSPLKIRHERRAGALLVVLNYLGGQSLGAAVKDSISFMSRPRKAMSEWVVHCEVNQRHVRRSQPTQEAALKDACSQLVQGHAVNR